ncbi:hypothetical protein [Streptomyces sp. Wb2n-11]|uniref:hypothetical protein n=1 Tax=Streptomyces sp. Wb2n-11 TaxID=1030533 RepID=UPI001C3FF91A|nr:hypothetical protein [Streptomyces sp. Wb2n-11]
MMTAGLDEHMNPTETGALARRLFALGEGMEWGGRWYGSDVRALAEELGRTWLDTAEGPRALTGLRAGDARAVPADGEPNERRGQEYAELAVPVARAAPDALAQATAFRRVADAVTGALDAAAVAGSYGGLRPFTDVVEQSWGTPYPRRQNGPAALELRAGASGPELVLGRIGLATSWCEWPTYRGRGFPGFFGVRGRLADVPRRTSPRPGWCGPGRR